MRRAAWLAAGSVVALFAVVGATRADEEKVPLDKVPKAVMDAVKKRFSGVEIVGASKETENGKTVFEVELKEKGKGIDVTVSTEGVIQTIEKEIDAKDLPKKVAGALGAKYPGATYKKAEEVIKVADGQEKLEYYEVLLTTADKKTVEVEIAPDGTIKNEEKKGDKD